MATPSRRDSIPADLFALIVDYQQNVSRACKLLQERYRVDRNILDAWRNGRIPEHGWLDDEKSTSYYFHGIGCCVKFAQVKVDFDFGPEGRHDGFDAWRLARFAATAPGFAKFSDVDILEGELAALASAGTLVHLTIGLGGHLYYFADTTAKPGVRITGFARDVPAILVIKAIHQHAGVNLGVAHAHYASVLDGKMATLNVATPESALLLVEELIGLGAFAEVVGWNTGSDLPNES